MHLKLQLMIHLRLYCAIKGSFEVALELLLLFYLLVNSLMRKSTQHNSSSGEFDGSLVVAAEWGLDVTLEGAPYTSL